MDADSVVNSIGCTYNDLIHPDPDLILTYQIVTRIKSVRKICEDSVALELINGYSWRECLVGLALGLYRNQHDLHLAIDKSLMRLRGIVVVPQFAILAILQNSGRCNLNINEKYSCLRRKFDGEYGWSLDKYNIAVTDIEKVGNDCGPNYGQSFMRHYLSYERIINHI